MSDHRITIEAKPVGRAGRSGSTGASLAAIREQSQKSKAMKDLAPPGGRPGGLAQSQERLTRATQVLGRHTALLTREVSTLSKEMKTMRREGGGGRGGVFAGGFSGGQRAAGGFTGGNVGAGIGRIGGGLGFGIGALVGALGFIVGQVTKVGRAYMQTVEQQAGTEGVAGFQKGRGALMGAEVGQFVRARRMAGGTFEGQAGQYQGTMLQYGFRMGVGMQELGQQVGTVGRFTGQQKAGATFENIIKRATGAGAETQVTELMSAMTSELKSAVTEGMDDSKMPDRIANEMIMFSRTRGGGFNVQAGANIARKLQQQQVAVSQGDVQTVASQRMLGIARNMLEDKDVRYQLAAKGIITTEQLDDPTKMGANTRRVAAQYLMTNNRDEIKQRYVQQLISDKGVAGKTKAEQLSAIAPFIQDYSGLKMTISEISQMLEAFRTPRGTEREVTVRRAERGRKKTGVGLKPGEQPEGLEVERVRGLRVQKELLLLSEVGRTAALATHKLDMSMINLAKKAAPAATGAIKLMTDATLKMAEASHKAYGIMNKAGKGGGKMPFLNMMLQAMMSMSGGGGLKSGIQGLINYGKGK